MNRKRLMLSAVLGLVLAACAVYLLLPQSLKLDYVLDPAHLATIHPEGTFANMTCPGDCSTLTQIVIIDEEDGADVPWRAAYICEAEGIFWIVDYRGGVDKIHWYGPFDASWDKTNILAAVGAVISGTALVIVIVTHHTPKPLTAKARKDAAADRSSLVFTD